MVAALEWAEEGLPRLLLPAVRGGVSVVFGADQRSFGCRQCAGVEVPGPAGGWRAQHWPAAEGHERLQPHPCLIDCERRNRSNWTESEVYATFSLLGICPLDQKHRYYAWDIVQRNAFTCLRQMYAGRGWRDLIIAFFPAFRKTLTVTFDGQPKPKWPYRTIDFPADCR